MTARMRRLGSNADHLSDFAHDPTELPELWCSPTETDCLAATMPVVEAAPRWATPPEAVEPADSAMPTMKLTSEQVRALIATRTR